MRRDPEIREAMERMKARVLECRAAHQSIEAAYAAIIVGALAYTLGETPTPATRVKIG